ncbi:DNA phosphorothioation-dependent restriction protein DptF [Aeromonas caviae]|uniref:DNA phosphorothioation-dependent restriction protein DptF n=1 Tax=Aeromonas caviae TaxID=648 RepID=UPI00388D506B
MFRLNRNERSHWSGNGVHVESELVFMIGRNMHLRNFYVKALIPAIFVYANRNAPELSKRELSLGQFGQCHVAAPIELKADYSAIQRQHVEKHDHFSAYLKVDDQPLAPMAINLNLFELICKLNNGYRPNKYDKNAIVLLDEMVEQIRAVAKKSPVLHYYEGDQHYRLGLDDGAYSHAWRSLNNIHADHSITSMPIAQ